MPSDNQPNNRRSVRLQGYDYSQGGAYFVTICTADRACLLGEISGDEMHLAEFGEIVREEWLKTAEIREAVELDESVIMPNHVHGVIIIGQAAGTPVLPQKDAPTRRDLANPAPVRYRLLWPPSNRLQLGG